MRSKFDVKGRKSDVNPKKFDVKALTLRLPEYLRMNIESRANKDGTSSQTVIVESMLMFYGIATYRTGYTQEEVMKIVDYFPVPQSLVIAVEEARRKLNVTEYIKLEEDFDGIFE